MSSIRNPRVIFRAYDDRDRGIPRWLFGRQIGTGTAKANGDASIDYPIPTNPNADNIRVWTEFNSDGAFSTVFSPPPDFRIPIGRR